MRLPTHHPLAVAQRKRRASREQFDEANEKHKENAARFFERLGLLSGGALVLSVSLLGLLAGSLKYPLRYLWSIHAAWGLFLVCLFCSLYAGFAHGRYGFWQTNMWLNRDLLIELREKMFERTEDSEAREKVLSGEGSLSGRRATGYWRAYRFCEVASQVSFFLATLALVGFAVMNIY